MTGGHGRMKHVQKTGNRGGSDRKVLNQEGGDGSEETRWTETLKDGPR